MEITSRTDVAGIDSLKVSRDKETEKDYTRLGKKGDRITGVVTGISDGVTMDFSGTEIKLARDSVSDAKEGQKRTFEITEVSKKRIVLKEVKETQQQSKSNGLIQTLIENDPNKIMNANNLMNQSLSDGNQASSMESINDRMTEEDVSQLEEEGMSLEKYELERLEKALSRIKEQRIAKKEGVEKFSERMEAYEQEIQKVILTNRLDTMALDASGVTIEQIAGAFAMTDLPVTAANIQKVIVTMNQSEVTPQLSQSAMGYLLGEELEPTISNVYHAQYAGESQKYNGYQPNAVAGYQSVAVQYDGGDKESNLAAMENDWQALLPQVEQILEQSGLAVNEENLQQAKWLFLNHLPITSDTLQKLDVLYTVKEGYDPQQVLEKVAEKIAVGENPETVVLIPEQFQEMQKKVEVFLDQVRAQSETIDQSIANGTGQQLAEELHLLEYTKVSAAAGKQENKAQGSDKEEKTVFVKNTAERPVEGLLLTRRRQLEEIRLKMTVDAADRLASKGITLDIDQVEQVVDGLRELEQDYYRNMLEKEAGIFEEEQLQLMQTTTDYVTQLKTVPAYVLGKTLPQADSINVQELYDQGLQVEQELALEQVPSDTYECLDKNTVVQTDRQKQANQVYEDMMTKPDPELGDRIQKAFRNAEVILKDLGMEPSEVNVRAVKILGHNQMPITEDNIYQVKAYDEQVNRLLNDLHPAVTMELIKRNINPLKMPITQLDEQVCAIKEELGITQDEKYSRFLYQLENRQDIPEQNRTTYINLYRLLNNIQKLDGAAVGYVAQSDREMTLENLLTAVRTQKSGGVEEVAADSQDMRDIVYSRDTLLTQVEEAFSESKEDRQNEAKVKYYNQVLDQLAEESSPSVWEKVTTDTSGEQQDFTNLYQQDVERLLETLRHAKAQQKEQAEETEVAYEQEVVKNLQQLVDNSDRMISYLTTREIPTTVENLVAAQYMTQGLQKLDRSKRNGSRQEQEVVEVAESLSEAMTSRESMQAQYETLAESVEQLMNSRMAEPDITSMDIRELQNLTRSVGLMNRLAKREDYQIPVVDGEYVTNMHVTIVNQKEQDSRVEITMDTKSFGAIEARFQLRGTTVNGMVQCVSRRMSDTLWEQLGDYEQRLQEQGMELGQMIYGVQSKSTDAYRATELGETDAVDNESLYHIAKAFVSHITLLEHEED